MDYIEGQPAKRRRVYSLEPKKVVGAVFTRKYLNYLVPALMKIKERSSTSSAEQQHNMIHCGDVKDVIKYEVDMAMVFSAQGFAWSNALKTKLQREEGGNVVGNSEEGLSSRTNNHYDQHEMAPSPLPPSSKSKYKDMPMKKDFVGGEEENEDDDEVMNSQLRSLRRLIPGGEDMCNEQMVPELESYISCLQMQVNILQYLAGTS